MQIRKIEGKENRETETGRLLSIEENSDLLDSDAFSEFKGELINSGIIAEYCTENPSTLSCLERKAIEQDKVGEFCLENGFVFNICEQYFNSL